MGVHLTDNVLASAMAREREEYRETVQGALQAYAEVEAGRTQPASQFLEELRLKCREPVVVSAV